MRNIILLIQLFTLLISCLAGPTLNYRWDSNSRIVGGKDAKEGQFPYIVSIRDGNFHVCGGSILNEEWILTAAHCLVLIRATKLNVVAGSNLLNTGGEIHESSKLIPHNDFSVFTAQNDIGLIKLSTPLTFNDNIKPIKIDDVSDESKVTLSGWGLLDYPGSSPNNLQYIDLITISTSDCNKRHQKTITEKQVCTFTKYGQGACSGDSGGPLVHDGTLVGVVSWGSPCAIGYPDVFTRVAAFKDWIANNMK